MNRKTSEARERLFRQLEHTLGPRGVVRLLREMVSYSGNNYRIAEETGLSLWDVTCLRHNPEWGLAYALERLGELEASQREQEARERPPALYLVRKTG